MITWRYIILVVSLLGSLVVGVFDYVTGGQISFSIFYLAPIFFATWYGSRNTGLTLAFVSASIWLISDINTRSNYSHVLIPYWNGIVRFGYFFLLSWLLAKLKTKLYLEEQIARTDSLTGIINTRAFLEQSAAELERARRYHRPFSLAYIDLDNFKSVNDSKGHAEGDELIKTVANVLRNKIRSTDIVARLGGDEFALLLPETNLEQAESAMKNIHNHLSLRMKTHSWPVTFSMGVSAFSGSLPNSVQEMISSADSLMYEAKNQGKNCILFEHFESSLTMQTEK